MTISSSLSAGVAGLSANANRLATIADNIANSATNGYKRTITDFHSMVVGESASRYVAGGVRTSSTKLIDERGALVGSSNATDLAVRGRGFLPVTSYAAVGAGNSNLPLKLMTTGSFRPDADGVLVSSSGQVLMGWPADSAGNIPTFARDTTVGLEPIRVNANGVQGEPTTALTMQLNLPATSTESTSAGNVEVLSVEYFDNLGKPQNLDITFTPTVPVSGSSNQWTMTITDSASGGAVVGDYTIDFNSSRTGGGTLASVTPVTGGPYDPLTGNVQINVAGGPMDISVGMLNTSSGLTQLSNSFAPISLTKNGYPVSNLTSVEVDANGYVHAYYETGRSAVIYQVPLIDVPNPNGLSAHDGQTYGLTLASGNMFIWDAGDGPTGDIVGYAQEGSTTDLAGELTSLIQTQRAYSSNAKVIQTVDEMLQETTNIKR